MAKPPRPDAGSLASLLGGRKQGAATEWPLSFSVAGVAATLVAADEWA